MALRQKKPLEKEYYIPSEHDLKMMHYFLLEYAAFGEKGLPPKIDAVPNETPDEKFERVKQEYATKRDDYETQFVPEQRCTASHRFDLIVTGNHIMVSSLRELHDQGMPRPQHS